jgi:pilus assembly protein CpaF
MKDKILNLLSDIYFAPIKDLLENDNYSDIYIRGPELIFIKERGSIRPVAGRKFESLKKLETAVNIIARKLDAKLDEKNPILDTRFETGERINVIIPPIALRPLVTIRKFINKYFEEKELIESGMIDAAGIGLLKFFVKMKKRIIISGAPNSGKTTILNLICKNIGEEHGTVISIEDTREIKIESPLWESLIANPGDREKSREERFREAAMNTLRMDVDILIIGEIRGAEITNMVTSFNTGVGGMATIHAGSVETTLSRMEALMKSHSNMREDAIRQLLSENIDIIVHVKTLADKSKRVTDIVEVTKTGSYELNKLYEFIPGKVEKGKKITGRFEVKHRPQFLNGRLFIAQEEIPQAWR